MERRISRFWLSVVLAASLAAPAAVVILILWPKPQTQATTWSGPDFTVSQEAYTAYKIQTLIENWQRTREALVPERGRKEPPRYNIHFVIDLNKGAIWIEEAGAVLEGQYFELPRKLKWSGGYVDPGGKRPLTAPERLKIRGSSTGPEPQEVVFLVGEKDPRGHVEFHFGPSGHGFSWSNGKYSGPSMQFAKQSQDPRGQYDSFVVSREEYEQDLRAARADRSGAVPAAAKREPFEWEYVDHSRWREVEKKLFQAVETELGRRGIDIDSLEIMLGPDALAGHIKTTGNRSTWLSRLIGGRRPVDPTLTFERLADGVWYVKSRRGLPETEPHLEFLVCAAEAPPAGDWLARGREASAERPVRQSPFNAVLPNGVTVEFIGVSTHPSAGRQWWRPDGTALEAAPYWNTERAPIGREGDRLIEMAYRITWPQRSGGGRTRTHTGLYYPLRAKDRYGFDLDIRAGVWAFEAPRASASLELEVGVGGDPMEKVEFRDISLAPGTNPGFEIVLGGGED